MKKFLTSESMTEGHPDKLCDYIADNILDEFIREDKESYVACEVAISANNIMVFGEVTSNANICIESIIKKLYVI